MSPEIKYYLVGSLLTGNYRRLGTEPHDIDIVGMLPQHDFEMTFGFTHVQLMEAYKEEPYGEKLRKYLDANRIAGWVFTGMLGKHVDFKWIMPSMLYKPHTVIELSAELQEVSPRLMMEVPL